MKKLRRHYFSERNSTFPENSWIEIASFYLKTVFGKIINFQHVIIFIIHLFLLKEKWNKIKT